MFGYFRFILATFVLLSHCGAVSYFGKSFGVTSVVSFYMLAGFVVTHLLLGVFTSDHKLIIRFYQERVLRIYPLYFFVLSLTVVFLLITQYGQPIFSFANVVNSVLVIPLNYYMFIYDHISVLSIGDKYWFVPTAWSLGAELQAYLILPFIVRYEKVKLVAIFLSIVVQLLAVVGIFPTDFYGYRLLPGILFIFILGSCICKNKKYPEQADSFDRYFPVVCFVACLVGVFLIIFFSFLNIRYNFEVLFGNCLAIIIISFLASSKKKVFANRLLGDLSYGIFLSHFLGIWCLRHFLPEISSSSVVGAFFVFFVSLAVSFLGVLCVERNFFKYRKMLATSNAIMFS